MTEQDDKPSAKNLENVENQVVVKDPSKPFGFERIRLEPAPEYKVHEYRVHDKTKLEYTSKDWGYCGLGKLTTGKKDPYYWLCSTLHDPAYEKLKAGHPDKTNMQVQAEFAKGVLSTAASGLYAFLTAPIYLLIGCIGGMARWTQLERRNAKARGEEYPSNTPED